ncbi:serine hydrolase domain-containing protein [Agrococcus jejuensis]|uniref:CubicO group peptidase, beta-lactamase class C family n=1 Tax=Agrococcus jejuensis TaxID=399736 RepID=A0A1G8EHG9_9MICO|nr:serine hydrolase domain-containing protein [Agrococcus jejuensis]SDH69316.1 CubicO group peptidase, beta-lactamase class C family [Agrococcus jejuensis]
MPSASDPTTLADRVASAIRAVAAAEDLSGVVRLSIGGALAYEEAFGVASRRWMVPVTTATRFDTASITKLCTSIAVLRQVDAGTLDLDAPIGDHLDLAGTTIAPAITLRHLLTHSSGIADDADEEAGESYAALWTDRPSYAVTSTADFLPQFAHKPPRVEPGADCRYCNVGYVLAGLVLEAVTGTPFREHVARHVLRRAGMDRSGFFHMADAVPDVAEGWDPVRDDDGAVTGWRQSIYSYPPIGSPDGGMHATAEDLDRLLAAVREGRMLSPALTRAFLSPQVLHHEDDDVAVHFAFGLELEVRADGSIRSLGKDGVNAGASGIVRHYPDVDATLVVLSCTEDGAWAPIAAADELLAD